MTGEGFGAPENVRMSYATRATLEEAVRRIKQFIEVKSKLILKKFKEYKRRVIRGTNSNHRFEKPCGRNSNNRRLGRK